MLFSSWYSIQYLYHFNFLLTPSLPSPCTARVFQRTPLPAGSSCRPLLRMLTSAQTPRSLTSSRELALNGSSLTLIQVFICIYSIRVIIFCQCCCQCKIVLGEHVCIYIYIFADSYWVRLCSSCVAGYSRYGGAGVCGTHMLKSPTNHSWASASSHKIKKAAQHDSSLTFCTPRFENCYPSAQCYWVFY